MNYQKTTGPIKNYMKQVSNKPFFFSIPIIISILSFSLSFAQQDIIDKAIAVSGTEKLKNAKASFDFRDYHYKYKRNQGRFEYTRIGKKGDSTEIRDVYTNKGLVRYVADTCTSSNELGLSRSKVKS